MKNLIAILGPILIPVCLYAVDGQVLINQSTVTTAGGFPYTISQPGSYKLSGNLITPSGTDAIHVAVSNVTLDLNGYSITTPTQPQVPATAGIRATTDVSGVTVRNGVIRGFTVPLSIDLGNSTLLVFEDLVLQWGLLGSSSGFGTGTFGRVVRISAPDQDISYRCPSVIQLNSARSISRDVFTPGTGTCSVANNATTF